MLEQNFFRRRRQDTHFNLVIVKQKTRASRYGAKDHYSAAEGRIVAESASPQ